MELAGDQLDDEYSVIGDERELGFIDYENDKSILDYNALEECPLVISAPFPFIDEKPQSVILGETAFDSITIENTTSEPMELWTKIYASIPENSFSLSLMKPPSANSDGNTSQEFIDFFDLEDRMVQSGETLTIWLSCNAKEIGLHTTVVHFDVGVDRLERMAFLLVEDKISLSLSSNKPFNRVRRKNQFFVNEFVSGSRPTRGPDRPVKNRLPWYDIPKNFRELVLVRKQTPDAIKAGLTRDNYASYFKHLLFLEELQLEEDMRAYNMENVKMRKNGKYLSLQVPGLAERRPSLVHGDHIFAKHACEDESQRAKVYQGFVHHVEADVVHLKFAPEFHLCHIDKNLYNIQFTYNRINMRRQYQAIDAAKRLELNFLFPSESPTSRLIEATPLVPISSTLNEEQMCSIEMILGCKGGSPYVIFGPPGTGKTMTVVEAILQLYKTQKHSRILVCAPSNNAADFILERLLNEKTVELKENEVFRLNASTRPYNDVNPDFLRFCFFDEFVFKCPPLSALCYRIIVSTYMSSSLLHAESVGKGHFSHIFLDEAGQASEPESMIPIANLCGRKTVVVLAGDPMQLGPVVYSKEAESFGLGKSYLQRLFECNFYSNGDENYVTKLIRNYRCEPEILHLPSLLFYNGELISCKEDAGSFLHSVKFLPNKEFPVFFFGIQGCDEREGSNPSWFNRIEASKVVEVVKSLTRSEIMSQEDIGVITPYRQQVLKIKRAFESLEMPDIKVGSVEQFQGQERKVIIISTVRSTVKHNEFDRTHCLGFLSNPRRFNVAITRAIALLVIIGNPHIIAEDPYWSKLIWRCVDNNSYQGCPLPERRERANEGFVQDNCWNPDESISADSWGMDTMETGSLKPITDEVEWSDGWE